MINITDNSTACAFCQYERYCGTAVSNMKLAKLGHCKIYNDKANEKKKLKKLVFKLIYIVYVSLL